MYSSAKKMSTISAIFCAVNAVGLLLYLMMSSTLMISFAVSFAIMMYMVSVTVISFMLTLSLRGLCEDLDTEYENNTMKIRELNAKIKVLEDQK